MAPSTRANPTLTKKIATLQLTLAPLVPLPNGPPHLAFPKTLLAFHLLTEDEMDGIAHYYHQSTPGPWTQHYPANMNWDKDFLARPSVPAELAKGRRLSRQEEDFLDDLMQTVCDLRTPTSILPSQPRQPAALDATTTATVTAGRNPYAGLSDKERIRIKRRKIGKFIGLVGMETPVEEIAGRIQASLDRAVERSREELRSNEEIMLRRKKAA